MNTKTQKVVNGVSGNLGNRQNMYQRRADYIFENNTRVMVRA